jgi:uracil-DNA glycosylase
MKDDETPREEMADSLHEYLRFYRDLGFTDLYLPVGATAFAGLAAGGLTPSLDASRAGIADPARESLHTAPGLSGGAETGTRTRRTAAAPPAARPGQDAPPASRYRPPQELFVGAESVSTQSGNPLQVLQSIETDIGECTRCRLHEGRSKIVFGSGNPEARLVFVGEGPGADEDAQGLPFVGRAGKLLTQMIDNTASGEGIPISREDVYICNVVKCRPPGNRTPEPDEMETCGQFLTRQLDAIRPKAICVLGATAARYLLGTRIGITKLRGNWQDWRGIPVMPTYHPSFLLRPYAQDKKREAWEDLKKVLHYVYDSE